MQNMMHPKPENIMISSNLSSSYTRIYQSQKADWFLQVAATLHRLLTRYRSVDAELPLKSMFPEPEARLNYSPSCFKLTDSSVHVARQVSAIPTKELLGVLAP